MMQNEAGLRTWGNYFLTRSTTSDFEIVNRRNLVDSTKLKIRSSDGATSIGIATDAADNYTIMTLGRILMNQTLALRAYPGLHNGLIFTDGTDSIFSSNCVGIWAGPRAHMTPETNAMAIVMGTNVPSFSVSYSISSPSQGFGTEHFGIRPDSIFLRGVLKTPMTDWAFQGSNTWHSIRYTNLAVGAHAYSFGFPATGSTLDGMWYLRDDTAGTVRLSSSANGLIGINTLASAAQLHVVNTNQRAFRLESADVSTQPLLSDFYLHRAAASALQNEDGQTNQWLMMLSSGVSTGAQFSVNYTGDGATENAEMRWIVKSNSTAVGMTFSPSGLSVDSASAGTLTLQDSTGTYDSALTVNSSLASNVTVQLPLASGTLATLTDLENSVRGGEVLYFATQTNAAGFTLTGTVKSTNTMSSTLPTVWTNAAVTTADGEYIAAFISTKSYRAIASGLGVADVFCFENDAGSGSISAEFYAVNSVTMAEEYEFMPAPVAQTVPAGTTPTKLQFSVPLTDYNTGTNVYIMVKLKVTESSVDPTIRIVSGGAYPSHATFSVPASTFVTKSGDTMTGPLNFPWTQITPDGTNAVLDIRNAGPNFYYTLTTSNYITLSNLTAGASGTIKIFANGTPQQVNFSSSYDNYSTNTIAPVFTVTNRAILAYSVDFGTDATNVNIGIAPLK